MELKEGISGFNWEEFESDCPKTLRNKFKNQRLGIEDYGKSIKDQKFKKILDDIDLLNKDLEEGLVYEVLVNGYNKNELISSTKGGIQTVFINISKERKFLESINFNVDNIEIGSLLHVYVEKSRDGSYSGSIEKGYRKKLKNELLESIDKSDSAYLVKILEINNGGFIVDLSGLKCFMPGSLSAANKIINFEAMIGRELYVMVESYLPASDMFVVSNKKYIKNILPQKIKELKFDEEYEGFITGSAPYGCFVEWNNIFTGLIHNSEMDPDLLLMLKNRNIDPGKKVKFWIKEIKNHNRIILTQKGPDPEIVKYFNFLNEHQDTEYLGGIIRDIKSFGIFIELDEDVAGMMSPKDFRKYYSNYREGDMIDVFIKKVDPVEKKIYLKPISK